MEFVESSDVHKLHTVPFRRNLRMPEEWKRPSLDRNKLLRMAMRLRFFGVYPSYDDFETRPVNVKKKSGKI